MKKVITLTALFIFIAVCPLQAKDYKDQIPKPKTKLEEFTARTGVVIVKGFETVGSIHGKYNSSIEIDAKEFFNASTGKKEYGITIQVKKGGRIERESTSYIDYDEVTSLVKGIDYISKIDKSATALSSFQADYNTKGDFRISTFSKGDEVMVAVSSGRIGRVTAYYNVSSLPEIKSLIKKAKQKIDSIR